MKIHSNDKTSIEFLIARYHSMLMNKTKIILDVPDQLVSKIDENVKENGYSSREEAILFILRYYFDKMVKTTNTM